MDVDGEDNGDSELVRKANDLVRLALFCEHKRTPLRRDDITKKVLGANASRAFNSVFLAAQEKLRKVFGMELVEIPSRAGLDQENNTNGNEEELAEARRATGVKKKSVALGSKTYMLRSCLHPLIIERAGLTDEQILEQELADTPFDDSDDEDDNGADDDERRPRPYGSLISWSITNELGILHVILALILVSGRVMTDVDFRTQLKRLRLPSTAGRSPVHFTTSSTHRSMSLDAYLTHLQQKGFLDRQQVGDHAAKKKGAGKRIRATQAEDAEEGRTWEWRWGPRAACEFVAEFMVGNADADEDEDAEEGNAAGGGRRRRAGGAATANANGREDKLKRMLAGVEKAAGGKLAECR
ncbi:hypothetical protein K443DRAFT_686926 [Laccaria amethystina LaAM-08-1]|uniref:MAGE domain-containing protein n=1 Tax=Laccaria amethystina LaAM-08-1 TaxID=1095629 RepID=A0A0C9WLC6_9AGAR|nr:hypothetical protein K443DRAFT_686926 [Laccaria amethystina LaAM-08-1]